MPTTTYTAIGAVTLATATAEVIFTVPTGYRDLVLVVEGTLSGAAQITARLNGDTASNYSHVYMQGGSSATSVSYTFDRFYLHDKTLASGTRFYVQLQFQDASATDKHKTVLNRSNIRETTTNTDWVSAGALRWASTSAITSISLTTTANQYAIGTTFNLWGIAA